MVKWRNFINMTIMGMRNQTKGKEKEGKHEKENEKNPFNSLSRSDCTALER